MPRSPATPSRWCTAASTSRSGQMQAIAAEFGLSETAFPLPPTTAEADYRLRIFTPARELPFAGHPSVGAAWVLAQTGLISTGDVVQECGAGLLPVRVDDAGAQVSGGAARGRAGAGRGGAGRSGRPARRGRRARRAGRGGRRRGALRRSSRARGAVARAGCPDPAALRERRAGPTWASRSCPSTARPGRPTCGCSPPSVGVTEDPATGSAAVALGVFLVDRGVLPADGQSGFTRRAGGGDRTAVAPGGPSCRPPVAWRRRRRCAAGWWPSPVVSCSPCPDGSRHPTGENQITPPARPAGTCQHRRNPAVSMPTSTRSRP